MVFRENYFDKAHTDRLKGIAAVLIVIHHLYQQTAVTTHWGFLSPVLQYFGYGLVAVFFFVSGYGITFSANKKQDYIQHFLRRRVLPLFLLYVFLMLLYVLTNWILNDTVPSSWQLIKSFFIGSTLVCHGWFFQSIILFYLCFWMSWRLTDRYRFTVLAATLSIYILLCILCNTSISYYISTPVFFLGCYFSAHKASIDTFCCRHLLPVAATTIFITILLFVGRNALQNLPPSVLLAILNILFVSSIVAITMLVPLQGRILDFLAAVSLEIYYIQGLAFSILRNTHWQLSPDICYIVSSLILTILLAYCFLPVTKRVMTLPIDLKQ